MIRRDLGPSAAFVACTLLWGTTFLAIRYGAATLPPLWGAFLRLFLAMIILGALALAFRQRIPRGAMLGAAIAYGVLEFGINLGLLYWAERVVPSGLAAVLYATAPLSAAFGAHLLGQERIRARVLLGTLVAIAGVVIAFATQLTLRAHPLALLAVLAAATAAGLSGVALRRVPAMPILMTNAIGCAAGAAMLLPASLLAREPIAIPLTWPEWGPVLYLVVAGSLLAFVLYTFLVNAWGATRAALLGITVPIMALIVGGVVGGEPLTGAAVLGGGVVLAGVALALAPARS